MPRTSKSRTGGCGRGAMNHKKEKVKYRILLFFLILNLSTLYAQRDSIHWAQYRNNDYKFSIKYPVYCYDVSTSGPISLKDREAYKKHNTLSFWLNKQFFAVSFGNQSVPIFSVMIFDNSENLDLETFSFNVINISPGFYTKKEVNFEPLLIQSFKGLKVIYKNKAGGYDGINKAIFIQRDNWVYSIMIFNPPEEEYDSFLDKLLSSFKTVN